METFVFYVLFTFTLLVVYFRENEHQEKVEALEEEIDDLTDYVEELEDKVDSQEDCLNIVQP